MSPSSIAEHCESLLMFWISTINIADLMSSIPTRSTTPSAQPIEPAEAGVSVSHWLSPLQKCWVQPSPIRALINPKCSLWQSKKLPIPWLPQHNSTWDPQNQNKIPWQVTYTICSSLLLMLILAFCHGFFSECSEYTPWFSNFCKYSHRWVLMI